MLQFTWGYHEKKIQLVAAVFLILPTLVLSKTILIHMNPTDPISSGAQINYYICKTSLPNQCVDDIGYIYKNKTNFIDIPNDSTLVAMEIKNSGPTFHWGPAKDTGPSNMCRATIEGTSLKFDQNMDGSVTCSTGMGIPFAKYTLR